jgi:hypothetical protein
MEYLNFELRIGPGIGREYPVSVLDSPAGESSATMKFPFDTLALQNQLQALEIAILRSGGTRRDVVSTEEQSVNDFGRQLFESLLTDRVHETFQRSRDRARASQKGLRLRLRIDAPELASLPWEYLYDPSEGDFVALSMDTPLIRYLEFDRPPEPLRIEPPLSILGVVASPSDMPALDVTREKQRIDKATAGLQRANLIKVTWLQGSTWRDLQRAMRGGPYHILHFVGHGGFDAASSEGVIALTDENGTSALMTATQLGRLLADHNSLRMVILNSCLGAKGSGTDVFSSTASILIRRGVPAVVGMQYEISDIAAVEFARSLYEALADGMPVDAAVTEARKAISMALGRTVEWGTPVLHMRSPDGVLFTIEGPTTSSAKATGEYESEPMIAAPSKAGAAPVEDSIPSKEELKSTVNPSPATIVTGNVVTGNASTVYPTHTHTSTATRSSPTRIIAAIGALVVIAVAALLLKSVIGNKKEGTNSPAATSVPSSPEGPAVNAGEIAAGPASPLDGAGARPGNRPIASGFMQENTGDNLIALFEALRRAIAGNNIKKAAALTRGLIPDAARIRKALRDDVPPETATHIVAALFQDLPTSDERSLAELLKIDPAKTEVRVHSATTEQISHYANGSVAYREFPGGAQRVAKTLLRPHTTFYEVEMLEPGHDSGMTYHLFFWDGAQWTMLGALWRVGQSAE